MTEKNDKPASRGVSVEFRDVCRYFGATHAVESLNLRLEPGEMVALLGPSGCGKTTALRLLAGFDEPTSGEILVDDADVAGLAANKRDMGMVFQSYSLFPTMTALENVAFGLRMHGHKRKDRRKRAEELLDMVGLCEHMSKYAHQLSGGQQQRVALARALAISPSVLLLDEPLSALDAKVREQLREEIRRIQLNFNVTALFVTHDQAEALSIADRIGVMRNGHLEQCDRPQVLYEHPATAFVAQFIGTMNQLPGVIEGDEVIVHGQSLPVDEKVSGEPTGKDVFVLVRPEAVSLRQDSEGDATVTAMTFQGANTQVRLVYGNGDEIIAHVNSVNTGMITQGSRVNVEIACRPLLVVPR